VTECGIEYFLGLWITIFGNHFWKWEFASKYEHYDMFYQSRSINLRRVRLAWRLLAFLSDTDFNRDSFLDRDCKFITTISRRVITRLQFVPNINLDLKTTHTSNAGLFVSSQNAIKLSYSCNLQFQKCINSSSGCLSWVFIFMINCS